jgi:erythromycin esterase-like protein
MTTLALSAVDAIRKYSHPLIGDGSDFDPLLRRIGDARYVLLGEASHGTHEFYRIRAEITKRLIREQGFTAVAVEADWPDAFRINRFVRGRGSDADATEALGGFQRFPQWMWRNADVLDFVGWLRSHNDSVDDARQRVGFYGLDVYSLHASMAAVTEYLWKVDPDAARRAEARYACFDQFGPDPARYGLATARGLAKSCEAEVVAQLIDLRRSAAEYARRDGRFEPDTIFYVEQNARIVRSAEQYYRAMVRGDVMSWNLRDQHMASTLGWLTQHLEKEVSPAKIVVWAHNSHLGDAQWTEMATRGETNVGEIVRAQHKHDAVLVGFTTYAGTVTAANDWGSPAERKTVRNALPGSYEALLHEAADREQPGTPRTSTARNFLLAFNANDPHRDELRQALEGPMLERAIGVIYRPRTERQSHYFTADLPRQFDAVLHYDLTRAVEPMERTTHWERGDAPETYPSAL